MNLICTLEGHKAYEENGFLKCMWCGVILATIPDKKNYKAELKTKDKEIERLMEALKSVKRITKESDERGLYSDDVYTIDCILNEALKEDK